MDVPVAPVFPPARKGDLMGRPVVHFEVMANDAEATRSFFASMFGWEFDANNPMNYGTVAREANVNKDGIGIGGGIGAAPEGYGGHVTFYVEVPDVEAALVQAEQLGGSRMMGPEQVAEGVEIGLLNDPEGRLIGVIRGAAV
jgi:predicted enzyme related to lactoylglutathione lyase